MWVKIGVKIRVSVRVRVVTVRVRVVRVRVTSFGCLPAEHLAWGVQSSVMVLLLDAAALKNPSAHFSHWGWAVVVPATLVNSPAGHLVWKAQSQPIRNTR